MPRAAILWPQRRSIVSSIPITIGPMGANRSRIASARASDGATVPPRPAEHMVIAREIAGRAEAHDAQSGAHRALSRGERHPGDERQHGSQTGAVKKFRKGAIREMMIDGAIGAAANEEEER